MSLTARTEMPDSSLGSALKAASSDVRARWYKCSPRQYQCSCMSVQIHFACQSKFALRQYKCIFMSVLTQSNSVPVCVSTGLVLARA
eukprot:821075-Rhodomonas_salina.1